MVLCPFYLRQIHPTITDKRKIFVTAPLRSLRARERLITFRTLITFSCTSKILIQVTDHFPFSIFQPFSLSCRLSGEEVLRFLRVQLHATDSTFDRVLTRKYLTGRVLQYKKITNTDGMKRKEGRKQKERQRKHYGLRLFARKLSIVI